MSGEGGSEQEAAQDSPGRKFEDVGKGVAVLTTFCTAWVALQKAADVGRRDSLAVTLAVTGIAAAVVWYPRPRRGDPKPSRDRYLLVLALGLVFVVAGAAVHFARPDKAAPADTAKPAGVSGPGPVVPPTGPAKGAPNPSGGATTGSGGTTGSQTIIVAPGPPTADGHQSTAAPQPTTPAAPPPTSQQPPAGNTPTRGPETLVVKAQTEINLYSRHADWDVGNDATRTLYWNGDPTYLSVNGEHDGFQDSSVSVLPSGVEPTENNCRAPGYKGVDPTPLHAGENFCVDMGGGPILLQVTSVVGGTSGSLTMTATVWGA